MHWEILGLNKYESSVYETLIKHGASTAFDASKNSKAPYGRIYDVLEELIKKSLIRIVPGIPKKYSIADPKIVADIVRTKKKEFLEIERELTNLKKIYASGPEETIEVARGKPAFYKIIHSLGEPKKMNYAIKHTSEYNPEWVRFAVNNLKKGVDIKILTRYDSETEKDVNKWKKSVKPIKKYPNKGVPMWITDKAVVITLINSNATIVIKDKAFIELMKNLFLDAYTNADEIK